MAAERFSSTSVRKLCDISNVLKYIYQFPCTYSSLSERRNHSAVRTYILSYVLWSSNKYHHFVIVIFSSMAGTRVQTWRHVEAWKMEETRPNSDSASAGYRYGNGAQQWQRQEACKYKSDLSVEVHRSHDDVTTNCICSRPGLSFTMHPLQPRQALHTSRVAGTIAASICSTNAW